MACEKKDKTDVITNKDIKLDLMSIVFDFMLFPYVVTKFSMVPMDLPLDLWGRNEVKVAIVPRILNFSLSLFFFSLSFVDYYHLKEAILYR